MPRGENGNANMLRKNSDIIRGMRTKANNTV